MSHFTLDAWQNKMDKALLLISILIRTPWRTDEQMDGQTWLPLNVPLSFGKEKKQHTLSQLFFFPYPRKEKKTTLSLCFSDLTFWCWTSVALCAVCTSVFCVDICLRVCVVSCHFKIFMLPLEFQSSITNRRKKLPTVSTLCHTVSYKKFEAKKHIGMYIQ